MSTFILQHSLKPLRRAFFSFLLVVFRNSSPGFLKDISKHFFGCFLPFVIFSVQMIPQRFNNVEVRAVGGIHPSIRPVATDFQSSFSIIWHTSAFSLRLPFLWMALWWPPFMDKTILWKTTSPIVKNAYNKIAANSVGKLHTNLKTAYNEKRIVSTTV